MGARPDWRTLPRKPWPDRFWAKVNKTSTCWIWTAGADGCGYGTIFYAHKIWKAHRLAWHLAGRKLPPGMRVCHRCDTPGCVRVDHLFVGSHRDNMIDMRVKGRGRGVPGNRHSSKLTDADVRKIRKRRAAGEFLHSIGLDFGISAPAVCLIAQGKTFSGVA